MQMYKLVKEANGTVVQVRNMEMSQALSIYDALGGAAKGWQVVKDTGETNKNENRN